MRKVITANRVERAPLTQLSVDEKRFKLRVKDFAEKNIEPFVYDMDKKAALNEGLSNKLFSEDLMNIEIPVKYGGLGGKFFETIIAIEEIAKIDPAVAVFVDVQNTLVNNAIMKWSTKSQREQLLPLLAESDVGAFSITEEDAGSDAYALTTEAVKVDGGYLINGKKQLVTNAAEAEIFILFAYARQDESNNSLTAFIIRKSKVKGLTVLSREEKMGIRASSTCGLLLEDVYVADEYVLGKAGLGKQVALDTLTDGRIGIASQMIGLAQGAFDHAVQYSKNRRQFNQPICNFQGVYFSIAEMAASIEAARLLVYNAAELKKEQVTRRGWRNYFLAASMAKYHASKVAEEVVSRSLEIFGGKGYLKGNPLEKLYRDAKIGKIYEGTSNMQLRSIARMYVNYKD